MNEVTKSDSLSVTHFCVKRLLFVRSQGDSLFDPWRVVWRLTLYLDAFATTEFVWFIPRQYRKFGAIFFVFFLTIGGRRVPYTRLSNFDSRMIIVLISIDWGKFIVASNKKWKVRDLLHLKLCPSHSKMDAARLIVPARHRRAHDRHVVADLYFVYVERTRQIRKFNSNILHKPCLLLYNIRQSHVHHQKKAEL